MEKHEMEKAVLVGVSADCMDKDERSTEISMDELKALLETAGGEACAIVLQNRQAPDSRSFIGEGKVAEIKQLIEVEECSLAVFDNELTPSQMKNLSDDLGVRVLDRSGLILDIFAQRAASKEGQLQVALAQYKYLLPRLTGMWTHLVRQTATGGGSPIGTRGPGETQLESDRRHIRRKITKLEEELESVRKTRTTQRRLREKNDTPTIALVGYTNAGKSTLLNKLTDSDIHTGDRLFDTLDTTTRRLRLNDTLEVLVSDTVGFIRKLPHHLIEAFKATLEELCYAQLLLHVIDVSNPDWEQQAEIVEKLIRELGAESTPIIKVYNKCDKLGDSFIPKDTGSIMVSARSGENLDRLIEEMIRILDNSKRVTLHIPYSKAGLLDMLHNEAGCVDVEYCQEYIKVSATCNAKLYGRVREYAVEVE